MKWSLDVHFKTKIRPAALSAIIESHDSIVTGIQWIHPMNKVSQFKYIIILKIIKYCSYKKYLLVYVRN